MTSHRRYSVIGLYLEPRQAFVHHVEAVDEKDALNIVEHGILGDSDFLVLGVADGHINITNGSE